MSQLSEYLTKTDQNLTAFAREIGISQSYMSEISSGRRNPSYDVAHKIFVKTQGAITMQWWAERWDDPNFNPGRSHSATSPKATKEGATA